MKAKIFFPVFMALAVFLFVGCGLDIPNTTQQIELTGPSSLSVGAQCAHGSFSVSTYNGKVFSAQGTDYTIGSKKPYVWTLSYYDGPESIRRVFEIDAQASLAIDFYLPGKYLLRAHVPTSFYSGVVENTTIPTQDELTIIVSEASGYKKDNFLPGLMVVTPYSAYFLRTEIVEIQNWGNIATGYTPPVDNNPIGGNDVIVSFNKGEEVSAFTNSNIVEDIYIEGHPDKVTLKFYLDFALFDTKETDINGENGWTVTAEKYENGYYTFSAENKAPNLNGGAIKAFKLSLRTLSMKAPGALAWQKNDCYAWYSNQKVDSLTCIDGVVRIK